MGAAARQRACDIFHPDVVMSQIEELFQDLQARRQGAVVAPSSPSPQLDLVRTFACYATNGEADDIAQLDHEKLPQLPQPVRALRGPLWELLRDSLPEERHYELWAELVRKHSHHADLSQSC